MRASRVLAATFAVSVLAASCGGGFVREWPFPALDGERVVDMDAGRDAFLAVLEAPDGSEWVVANGERLGPFDAVGAISASRSGGRWQFVARNGASYVAISESGREGPYSSITIENSGDGRVEYSAESGAGSWVRTRERLSGPYAGTTVKAAKTGERAAFILSSAEGDRVAWGGTTEGPWDSILPGVKLSADGKTCACVVMRSDGFWARWNGEERGPYSNAAVLLSADGQSVAVASASPEGTLSLEVKRRGGDWKQVDLSGAVGFGGAVFDLEGTLVHALAYGNGLRIARGDKAFEGTWSDVSRWTVFPAGWSAVATSVDGLWYVRSGESFGPFERVVRSGVVGEVDYFVGIDSAGLAWTVAGGKKLGPWKMVGDVTARAGNPRSIVWPASVDGVVWKAWSPEGEIADLGPRFFVRRLAMAEGPASLVAEFIESRDGEDFSVIRFAAGGAAAGETSTAGAGSLLVGVSEDGSRAAYWVFDGKKSAEPRLLDASGTASSGTLLADGDGGVIVVEVIVKDGARLARVSRR